MTPLASLWIPILVTVVLLFVASSLIHTVLPWHKSDFKHIPEEEAIRSLLGPLHTPPGDYVVPHCTSMSVMSTPEHQEKLARGPVLVMTVLPNGQPSMGPKFLQWIAALIAASILTACIAAAALPPGAERRAIWHLTGLVTLGIYAFGSWPQSIWLGRDWWSAAKDTFDAVIYAAITAGVFGWFWPSA